MGWRAAVAGIVLVAGLGLTGPASAEPELVLPEGATDQLPPELEPPLAPRTPSAEAVRVRDAVTAALTAPAAAGTVTVTPSTGLVHGQEVAVSGSGMTPGHEVVAIQC